MIYLLLFLSVTSLRELGANYPPRRSQNSGYVKRSDTPCEIKKTGPWADYVNVTVTPNPPRLNEYVKLVVDLVVKENIWLLTIKWNATMDGTGIIFRVQRILCDIHKKGYVCPAKEGSIRHYEKELNPGFMPKGAYSGQLEVTDQYGDVVIRFSSQHCPIQ